MRNLVQVKNLINLTRDDISLYCDQTGEICSFAPESGKISVNAKVGVDKPPATVYVVEPKKLRKIKETGRELDDIAFVVNQDHGRDGVVISRLAWAKNPRVMVRLA